MFVAPVFSLGLQLPLRLSPQITENTLTTKEMGSCILNFKNVNFKSFEKKLQKLFKIEKLCLYYKGRNFHHATGRS